MGRGRKKDLNEVGIKFLEGGMPLMKWGSPIRIFAGPRQLGAVMGRCCYMTFVHIARC
jgi:hypothetical protein